MSEYNLNTANIYEWVKTLRAGDVVNLSGYIYTARDAAHKRIVQALNEGEDLPFELQNSVVYYAGPTPAKNGLIIGSVGPTTSSRMDVFTPMMMDNGLSGMIGKGPRNQSVIEAIKRNKGVYFCAIGGAGALAALSVKGLEVIAFEDLGCESVKRLKVENFPLLCAIDCKGNSIFDIN